MSIMRTGLLGLGLLLLPPALAQAQESADAALEQLLVESATTPQQHQALANYYRAKAKAARERAAEHKRMGNSYGGTKMTMAQAGKQHCDKLSALNESEAQEYDKMAAEHEALAKK